MTKTISGFSKFTKTEKIDWLVNTFFSEPELAKNILKNYWNDDEQLQQLQWNKILHCDGAKEGVPFHQQAFHIQSLH